MDADDKDPGPGGGRPKDIRFLFNCVSTGGVAFWVRDVGDDHPYGAGPGKFPEQGCATDHRESAEEAGGGQWEYPTMAEVMEEAGFEDIGVYIFLKVE